MHGLNHAMSSCVPTRRRFLKAVGAAAGISGLPALVSASVFGARAPSNRITVGQIGCGHQSQRIVPSFLVHDDVQMVAVCDVNRQGRGYYWPDQVLGRETARRWVDDHYAETRAGGRFRGCDAYNDFRELLAREDIDAVAVVVPDHWHALIAIAALAAGKDVYCEKPLSLTIRQGRLMVEAVRRYGRVFQTGAQFRSCPGVRRACELVRNGFQVAPPPDQWLAKLDTAGNALLRLPLPAIAAAPGRPGEVDWVHAVAVDSKGNIYLGDIQGKRAQKFRLRSP